MKTIVLKQGTQEWLAWRAGGIGSSDAMVIAAAAGMVEKRDWMKSLDDLYEEKITGVSHVVENPRMRRGTEGEPIARTAFEQATGMVLQPLCAEMDANPQMRASFDGITFDGRETIEIKCPNDKVHALAKEGQIVDYYIPQVVHQALVAWGAPDQWTDDEIVNFFSFVPETGDSASVRKHAVEFREFAAELYVHEQECLVSLSSGVPPCGAEYVAEAATYATLDVQIKALEKKQAVSKKRLIEIVQGQGRDGLSARGVSVIHSTRAGTVDWKRVAAEHGITEDETAAYRSKGSDFWQVRASQKAAEVVAIRPAQRAAA